MARYKIQSFTVKYGDITSIAAICLDNETNIAYFIAKNQGITAGPDGGYPNFSPMDGWGGYSHWNLRTYTGSALNLAAEMNGLSRDGGDWSAYHGIHPNIARLKWVNSGITAHIEYCGIFDLETFLAGSSTEVAPERVEEPENPFISKNYTEDKIYSGQYSYHTHHRETPNMPKGEFKGHRIGVELEVCATSRSNQSKINSFKSNWFYQESDSSLSSYGIELITIPLLPKDAKKESFWKVLTDNISGIAKSWDAPGACCGLHVHIGREILGDTAEKKSETLGKLLYFYHHLITADPDARHLNEKIYGRAHTYHENLGDTEEGKVAKIFGNSVLKSKDVCSKIKNAMIEKSSTDRYFDINLMNTNTIEFRKGKGSINPARISAVVAWSEGMVDYCRKTSWENLNFNEFVAWIRDRRGTPNSLISFLNVDR